MLISPLAVHIRITTYRDRYAAQTLSRSQYRSQGAQSIPRSERVGQSVLYSYARGRESWAPDVQQQQHGGGTLAWSAGNSATWLTLSRASGTGNGAMTVSVTIGTLTTGNYSDTVKLNATGASAVTMPVTFTITAAAALTVSPASFSFTVTQEAANPVSQSMTVSSNGTWTVSKSATWLTVGPTSGSNNGTITASVNTATATLGTNTATITVTGGGTTQTETVALTLNAPATSSVTLTWNPNTETDTASCWIYRSTIWRGADDRSDTGDNHFRDRTSRWDPYYFTITAVDAAGNKSPHCNEVSASIF